MATNPHAANFFTFVTAHSAFELTAIVVSAAAGLRLGWGLIDTQGQSRMSSLRREAVNGLPAVGAAVVLFVLAALVEGLCLGVIVAVLGKGFRRPLERAGDPCLPGAGGRAEVHSKQTIASIT